MTKTMKKKGLFARMTALAMACAMALSVAAGAIDNATHSANLYKSDFTSTSHANGVIDENNAIVSDDGKTITIDLVSIYTYGMYGVVTGATSADVDISFEATGETDENGFEINRMTITSDKVITETFLTITFTVATYTDNSGSSAAVHEADSTAYLYVTE